MMSHVSFSMILKKSCLCLSALELSNYVITLNIWLTTNNYELLMRLHSRGILASILNCIRWWGLMIWFGWVLWQINHCRLFNTKSFLYIYIKYIGFGWVLWHINHCRLFNVKSSLYIYIKYIWFGGIWFYGISTIVDYSIPNPFYTYILKYIYDL